MPEASHWNSAFSFSMPLTGPGSLTHSGGVCTCVCSRQMCVMFDQLKLWGSRKQHMTNGKLIRDRLE